MRNYSDKDLNRILNEADELLANIQLYETPEEEAARKEREEQERLEELKRRQEEEQKHLEELLRRQEEERRLEEEKRQQEEQLLREELQRQQEQTTEYAEPVAGYAEPVAEYAEPAENDEQPEKAIFGEESGVAEDDRWSAFLAERQEEDDYQAKKKAEKAEQKREKKKEKQKQKKKEEKQKQKERSRKQDKAEAKQKKQKEQERRKQPETETAEEAKEVSNRNTQEKTVGQLWSCGIFAAVCYAFMEALTHIAIYRSVDSTILYPILFAAGVGCVLAMLCSFFGKKGNTIGYLVVTVLMGAYYDLQIIYHGVTSSFLHITQLRESLWVLKLNQAMTLHEIKQVLPWLVIMFVPLLLWALIGRHWIRFEKGGWFQRLVLLFAGIILAAVAVLTLDIHGYDAGSPYVTFYHYDSMTMLEQAGKQLGVLVTTVLELLHG